MYPALVAVRIERAGQVTTVILDHPEKRNAIDPQTAEDLAAAFRAYAADDAARVAVLWGAGGCFCAGADLKSIGDPGWRDRILGGEGPLGPTHMLLNKPVIAAIAGHAVAGGLELAAWCDLRIVERSAVLGVFCRRWGVPLIDGGTVRLPRIIGMGRAMDLILTGRPVHADEALAIGLATRVVDDGTSRQEAERLAYEIAQLPQTCMREDRLSAYEQAGLSLTEALANERKHGATVIESGESATGAARFAGGAGRHGKPG